jgi:hypothetical protein
MAHEGRNGVLCVQVQYGRIGAEHSHDARLDVLERIQVLLFNLHSNSFTIEHIARLKRHRLAGEAGFTWVWRQARRSPAR